jgi:hypothetical protein
MNPSGLCRASIQEKKRGRASCECEADIIVKADTGASTMATAAGDPIRIGKCAAGQRLRKLYLRMVVRV